MHDEWSGDFAAAAAGGSGEEEQEDEAGEAEADDDADEAARGVEEEPEGSRRRRLAGDFAGGVQRQRSSEAVAPAVEVALLQRRELHSISRL